MTALRFRFPMPRRELNASKKGWRSAYYGKQKYLKHLDELQKYGLLPAPPPVPLARATVSSVMHLGGHMDQDNAMARHKNICDWLVTRGYVASDRTRSLHWLGFPEQIVSRRQEYCIELTLTPEGA